MDASSRTTCVDRLGIMCGVLAECHSPIIDSVAKIIVTSAERVYGPEQATHQVVSSQDWHACGWQHRTTCMNSIRKWAGVTSWPSLPSSVPASSAMLISW